MPKHSEFYTPPELAGAIGASRVTITRWCVAGLIRADRVPRNAIRPRWRIGLDEAKRVIKRGGP